MTNSSTPSSDIAFTPRIKAIQAERGSRAKLCPDGGPRRVSHQLTEELAQFLASVDTAFLATANAAGQPYAQHRGGPKGFIRIIGPGTLGFADYKGNRQYITTGNLAENDRAFLFLMDYAQRRRVKIWGGQGSSPMTMRCWRASCLKAIRHDPNRPFCSRSRPGT